MIVGAQILMDCLVSSMWPLAIPCIPTTTVCKVTLSYISTVRIRVPRNHNGLMGVNQVQNCVTAILVRPMKYYLHNNYLYCVFVNIYTDPKNGISLSNSIYPDHTVHPHFLAQIFYLVFLSTLYDLFDLKLVELLT